MHGDRLGDAEAPQVGTLIGSVSGTSARRSDLWRLGIRYSDPSIHTRVTHEPVGTMSNGPDTSREDDPLPKSGEERGSKQSGLRECAERPVDLDLARTELLAGQARLIWRAQGLPILRRGVGEKRNCGSRHPASKPPGRLPGALSPSALGLWAYGLLCSWPMPSSRSSADRSVPRYGAGGRRNGQNSEHPQVVPKSSAIATS